MSRTRLPDAFVDVQELADVFAVADDMERSRAEEQARPELKRRLVDTVGPRLSAINEHLDQHDDEAAWHLGRLAEATCEIALEVGWEQDPA